MAKRKRRKFYIDEDESVLLFNAFGFNASIKNFFTIRIKPEEERGVFYDWYHTQGTVVRTEKGVHRRLKRFYGDAEALAEFIIK